MSDNERSDQDIENPPQFGRLRSVIWENFTVIDRKNHIAVCNICDRKLSFKTTVTNLKKHVERKHPCNSRYASSRERLSLQKVKKVHREIKPFDIRNAKLTDIGGLEGLILNVIGEDGETDTIIPDHEANEAEIYTTEVHEYSAAEHNEEETSPSKENRASKAQQATNMDPSERKMRNRIMDLQLECLEMKKYNMQLEALMLEQQLNVRRSIFTEPLQYADSMTRGTQTDVGGENTRVFYLRDGKGGMPTRHLFAMQEVE